MFRPHLKWKTDDGCLHWYIYPGAYDNMLIDILCNILMEKELPRGSLGFWPVHFGERYSCFLLVVRNTWHWLDKDLPQGSVLSPFLHNIIGSCADRFVPAGCGFLQYADDLVVYVAHMLIGVAFGLIQTACASLSVFFLQWVLQYPLQSPRSCCFPKTRAPSDSD
jgi:hypothetical protein